MFRWPFKDPQERRAYPHVWTPRMLDGDSLVTLAGTPGQEATTQSPYYELMSGTVEVDQVDLAGNTTTLWLRGGELGERAELLQRVHTALGEVMDETFLVHIRTR